MENLVLPGPLQEITSTNETPSNEKTCVLILFETKWSDVGDWVEVWELNDRDDLGNVEIGDTYLESTKLLC